MHILLHHLLNNKVKWRIYNHAMSKEWWNQPYPMTFVTIWIHLWLPPETTSQVLLILSLSVNHIKNKMKCKNFLSHTDKNQGVLFPIQVHRLKEFSWGILGLYMCVTLNLKVGGGRRSVSIVSVIENI